ncbi:helix-turn-helix domain-containing protein [Streptomyces sp. NPDC059913]|uniref:helix-turn-helix domain-containing protein n=1 Tax=unclassified Streptomyces TaxID=2593676 RepID=UPI003666CA8D
MTGRNDRGRHAARCRADLTDPRLAGCSIQTIAARRGLAAPAHFSRLFRAAYGMTPSDYRHASVSTGLPGRA